MEPQVLWLEQMSRSLGRCQKELDGDSPGDSMWVAGPGREIGDLEPLRNAEMEQSQDSQV